MAGKRVLMVEGVDDEHVVKHICGERQLGLIDKIRDCKGKDPLLDQRRFDDLKKPKARIHTWLAWQEEPGKPFGQAITARYLDPNLPAADIFARWLQRTFFAP